MERKGGRICLVNHSLLATYFSYEWAEARRNHYVTGDYKDLEKQEIEDERDLFKMGATLIKAKLERILICEDLRQSK